MEWLGLSDKWLESGKGKGDLKYDCLDFYLYVECHLPILGGARLQQGRDR